MAEVKWIKLTTDMFDNRKIRHLRKLPEGNNIVLIWVMLLTMAGKCNAGGMIFLTENIPYNSKLLAEEVDFEERVVELALKALHELGMIETDGDYFTISNWKEHQNVEGMERIREQNRIRKQNQRAKQKLAIEESHVTSRDSHATDIDIDKDKDTDIDIDKDTDKDKDKAIDKEKKKDAETAKSVVRSFGTHKNIMLTSEQYNELESRCQSVGLSLESYISKLSQWLFTKGRHCTDPYRIISGWLDNDSKRKTAAKPKERQGCDLSWYDDFAMNFDLSKFF